MKIFNYNISNNDIFITLFIILLIVSVITWFKKKEKFVPNEYNQSTYMSVIEFTKSLFVPPVHEYKGMSDRYYDEMTK